MKPQNLLFILFDEHYKKVAGAYGHKMIRTPNLDRLAAREAIFKGGIFRYSPTPGRKPAMFS